MPIGVYERPFKRIDDISEIDLGWLAGILEGEGSFYFSVDSYNNAHVHITVYSIDKDTIDRIAQLWHQTRRGAAPPRQSHHRPQFFTMLSGEHAVHVMEKIYPLMCERRKIQIRSAIIGWENRALIREWMRQSKQKRILESTIILEDLGL